MAWLRGYRRLRIRDERRADMHQAFLKLGCALIPKAQPPVAPQPSPGAFHHPPMPSQPLGRLDATPGYPRPDAATAASLAAPTGIVGFVRVQLGRSLHGPARPRALEGRNGLSARAGASQQRWQRRVSPLAAAPDGRRAGGACCRICLGQWGWARSGAPFWGGDALGIEASPAPFNAVPVTEALLQPLHQLRPDAGLVPLLQPTPATHA